MDKIRHHSKKTAVGIVGTCVLVAGIIMIPAPGPGWLIVFAGLGILSTEFEWAGRLLKFAKKYYQVWEKWIMHQSILVRALVGLVSAILVVLGIWLINGYGFMDDLLGLKQSWLHSPFLW